MILVVFNQVLSSGSLHVKFECTPPHLLKDNLSSLWDQFPPTNPTHARLELWRIPQSPVGLCEWKVCVLFDGLVAYQSQLNLKKKQKSPL